MSILTHLRERLYALVSLLHVLSATSLVEDQLGRKRMASKALKIAFSTVALSVGGALGTPDVFAQDANNLVGTWTLVSSLTEKDQTRTDQFGSGAKGMLTFDVDKHFMLIIIGPDLPKFASGNRAGGSSEENKAVVSKSIAMMGTYSVNSAEKSLTFKVDSATFPNRNGTEQKRLIATITTDELKYVTPTASSGGVGRVTWRRAK